MKWSVGMKIGSIVVLAVLVLFILAFTAKTSTNSLLESARLREHTYKAVLECHEILDGIQNGEAGQQGYVLTGEESYLEPFTVTSKKTIGSIANVRDLTKDNPAQQKRLVALELLIEKKIRFMAEAIELRKARGIEDAAKLIQTYTGKTLMDDIRKILGEMVNEEEKLLASRQTAMSQDSQSTLNVIIYGGFLAALILVIVGSFITQMLSRRLANLSRVSRQIAGGNLAAIFPEDAQEDEIGELSESIRSMVERLLNGSTDIAEAATLLVSSANEILTATTQVASSTAETVTAIGETTTTIEEVRQAAQLSSQKAKEVSDTAQRIGQVVQSGRKSVEETVAAMRNIHEQMDSVAKTIVHLSEQSQSIGGIIAAVTDIADQSNLLSVNAAIEAAKAGEQGKGFTVVAQEIKSLAEQSKQSTNQVRSILNDIQKATSAAVMATELGTKAVNAGVNQSTLAGDSIKLLAESIDESARSVMQIVASSQQQVIGMDQICIAMENIQQSGSQNVESIKQTENVAKQLNTLGMKLKSLVDQNLAKQR
jgi:methyl-accepting chemotaxis protein